MSDFLQNLELVIFDCDGVLIDSETLSQEIMADLTTGWGHPCSVEDARHLYMGHTMTECHRILQEDLKTRVPDNFLEIYNREISKRFQTDLKPIPGIVDVLKDCPFPKCVASNGSLKKMQMTLPLTGLDVFFRDQVFSAEQVAKPKPHPDLFLFAAKQMQAHPKNCLVIEDSKHGIAAAKKAGMWCFGFSDLNDETLLKKAGADEVFFKMEELQKKFAALASVS